MILTLLGVAVAAGCAAASGKRLQLVAGAWSLDPRALATVTGGEGGPSTAARLWPALRAEITVDPDAVWERELIDALEASTPARVALVNELLAELDYRARWARVPRVCASISTSFGFLLAAIFVAVGLASVDDDLDAAMLGAVNAIAIGVAGTAFCIAAQMRAATMVRERLAATDKLVARLERWAAG